MKKCLKKRSKRLSTRDRVKQEKKKREYDRKIRKDKRDNPQKYRKSKKDPGVPNLCPFKEDVLNEAQDARDAKESEKIKRREILIAKRKEAREALLESKRTKGLQGFMDDAQSKREIFETAINFSQGIKENFELTDGSAKAFYKEFSRVVDTADVVLQILDARDPLGTRCKEVEQTVTSDSSKRLILVLNKADLVPKENLKAWLKYLRREYPTTAFKASTQNQGDRLGISKKSIEGSTDKDLKTSKCVGAESLMTLLKNYCRNKEIKTSINVGIVGLPNVGKSSIINSLKRSKACVVGSVPGVTKKMQTVNLDSQIKLLDSPGMVLASGSISDSSVALRNAIKIESLEDPITPVKAILARIDKRRMILQYTIMNYDSESEFLNLIARKIGKLKPGGIPDAEAAARHVLRDWNTGKIKYFTHPPEDTKTIIKSEIVQEFSKEFDLNDVKTDQMESNEFEALPEVLMSDTEAVASMEMVETCGLPTNIQLAADEKKANVKEEDMPKYLAEKMARLKKVNKIREKKNRKELRRRELVGSELADDMELAFDTLNAGDGDENSDDDNYDVDKDYKM